MSLTLSMHLQTLSGSGLVFFASVIVVGRMPHRRFQRHPKAGLRPMKALKSRLRKMFKGRAD
jgi:hypothetical protein